MNIYLRYFDHEEVFATAVEVVDYLIQLNDFTMTKEIRSQIIEYGNTNMPYPKHVKVRPNIYFILIKTTAQNLAEYKANRKTPATDNDRFERNKKEERMAVLSTMNEGWYKGQLNFKRVIVVPGTSKCQYIDASFSAYVYAESPLECYNKIIEHLRNRQDVDSRCQYPSAKGNNYSYTFLGTGIKD